MSDATTPSSPQVPVDPQVDPAAAVDALEANILRDPVEPDDDEQLPGDAPSEEESGAAFEQDIELEDLPAAGGSGKGIPEPPA